jgi:hypothetical protein
VHADAALHPLLPCGVLDSEDQSVSQLSPSTDEEDALDGVDVIDNHARYEIIDIDVSRRTWVSGTSADVTSAASTRGCRTRRHRPAEH